MTDGARRAAAETTDSEPEGPQAAPGASPRPLLYSCSGCSSAAQMANHLAVQLDRRGVGEMSCIAGVGGDVPSLVQVATSGRPIVALDGCPLDCVRSSLARHGVSPTVHLRLSGHGVKRRKHEDFDRATADMLLERFTVELGTRFGTGRRAP